MRDERAVRHDVSAGGILFIQGHCETVVLEPWFDRALLRQARRIRAGTCAADVVTESPVPCCG